MTQSLDQLFGFKDLRSSPAMGLHVVMATRLTILFARTGRDPLPDLAVRLRSMRAAQGVEALVQTIDKIWPEPFAVHRPCCMAMTPDEALLSDVVTAATFGDRAIAMEAMRDLLPTMARERLFRDAVELVDAIQAVRTSSESDPA